MHGRHWVPVLALPLQIVRDQVPYLSIDGQPRVLEVNLAEDQDNRGACQPLVR